MVDLNNYEGREQSYIKHQFLTKYLQEAAFKTLQGRSPIFNFVDAFAGPWSVADEDNYSDASFDQAIRTLETVRATLGRMGKGGLKIRFCFCEKRKSSFEKLTAYANAQKGFDIHLFHGSFEDNLSDIGKVCADGFTFSFIDPTGWDLDSGKIFKFLRDRKGEALINFMSNDINRFPDFDSVSGAYGRFLADPMWKDDYNALSDRMTNEEKILSLFRLKLKNSEAAKFTPDMIIQDRLQDRIKMRLILASFSSKGLELFRNVQAKVEKEEMALRMKTKRGDSCQVLLFGDEVIAQMQQDAFGVGCSANKSKAEVAIPRILEKYGPSSFQHLSDYLLERYSLKSTHVKEVLKSMREREAVRYDLPPKRRVPQPDTVIYPGQS